MVFEKNNTEDTKLNIENTKLNEVYEDGMEELGSFFEVNWVENRPEVVFLPDRKAINALRGRKTPDWLVGWVSENKIYMLSEENYETESNHTYSDEEYFALLKHELAHCFTYIAADGAQKPVWLIEGIAIFLSGQLKLKSKPPRFLQFMDFYENSGKRVYAESGFAVEFLVKKYGKEKLLKLLSEVKEIESEKDFAKLFKSIYGFELDYENFEVL